MHVPQWLALVIAGAVILFGLYRLYLAVGGPSDELRAERRSSMLRTPRWHHGLVGALLVLVGAALVATAFGWNPISNQPQRTPGVNPKNGPPLYVNPH
jgi:hypothetical protein